MIILTFKQWILKEGDYLNQQFEEFYINMTTWTLMTTAWRFDDWTDVGRNNGISRKHQKIICVMLKYV